MVDWFYRHLKGKTDYDNLPPALAALLGQVRLPRQQPRRHPAQAGPHPRHPGRVPRSGTPWSSTTCTSRSRCSRSGPAPAPTTSTSTPSPRRSGTRSPSTRSRPSPASACPACGPGASARAGRTSTPTPWPSTTTPSAAATRPSATRTAETVERVLDPERDRYTGRPVTEPDWYRTSPPPKKFKWSLRNNTNYMQTGVLAALQYAALHGPDMLRNFWRRGANAVRSAAARRSPTRSRIPEKQDDRAPAGRAGEPAARARHRGAPRAAGASRSRRATTRPAPTSCAWTSPTAATRSTCSLPQKYPADKAPYEPYDDVAWALPVELRRRRRRRSTTRRCSGVAVDAGGRAGVATRAASPATAPSTSCATRARRRCWRRACAWRASRSRRPRRPFSRRRRATIRPGPGSCRASRGLRAGAGAARGRAGPRRGRGRRPRPTSRATPLDLPRLAAAADLERHRVGGLGAHDLRRPEGPLHADHGRGRAQGRPARPLRRDPVPEHVRRPEGHRAAASTRGSARSPTRRRPSSRATARPPSSPDITGGLTWAGVGNLEQFVRAGGVLVTLGGASRAAARRRHRARRGPRARQGRLHAGQRAAGALPAARPPDRLRLQGDDVGLPRGPAALRACAAPTRAASCCSGGRRCRADDDAEEDAPRTTKDDEEGAAGGQRRHQGRRRARGQAGDPRHPARARAAWWPSTSTPSTAT